jgi:ribosomal protein S18 acetylase RimI-like enzyme
MNLIFRNAVLDDVDACVELRGMTREYPISVEQLRARGITRESWKGGISEGTLPGYVCLSGSKIVGYCFGVKESGEIAVLALLPEFENKGIGKVLLNMMVRDFRNLGFDRLFLGCSSNPQARSYGFYRHLGWRSTGTRDAAQDEILEYFLSHEV